MKTLVAHKEHFLALDFLRGVAALSVFAFHWLAFQNYLSLAFLGVDFFFMLSGFVVAYAYERRLLEDMALGQFCAVRLIRLYPMILAGLALGIMHGALRNFFLPAEAAPYSITALAAAANLFMVPVDLSRFNLPGMYPLDVALWSLFYELLANFIYAAFIRHWSLMMLALVAGAGFLGLCFMAVHRGSTPGMELSLGDALSGMSCGLARVAFAYFVGVLLFRWRKKLECLRSIKAPPIVLAAMILALTVSATSVPTPVQVGLIAVAFPAIILLGANYVPVGREAGLYAISGRLSYPFYVLHLPLLVIMMGFLKWRHLYDVHWASWFGVPMAAGVAVVSWLILRIYDEPVRRRLSQFTRGVKLR
jgi:peptidoglycan/LPS O-acetylase OafA/YrhL